jgi:single stranded DNA-binding protein
MSYANITVVGNVGRKPEVRSVGDTQGASFSIAVTEKFKTRAGELKERTHWYDVDAIGNLVSKVIVPYIDKGSQVLVSGMPSMETYESKKAFDSEGNPVTLTKMKVNISGFGGQLKLLGKPTKNTGMASNISEAEVVDEDIPF